jgi:hypothetical protein
MGTPQLRWREMHHSERPRTKASSLLRAAQTETLGHVYAHDCFNLPDSGLNVTSVKAAIASSLIAPTSANHCGVALQTAGFRQLRVPQVSRPTRPTV